MLEQQNGPNGGPKFNVVSDRVVDGWNELDFPIMSTSPYNLSGHRYSLTLGLFNYDTTDLQANNAQSYTDNFASGLFDGWSWGSVFYFAYYKGWDYDDNAEVYNAQGFAACLSTRECWGLWLYYDGSDYKVNAMYWVNGSDPSG